MRTTLDIDEDVLAGAKEIAKRESKTAGQVVSELLRRAMTQQATVAAPAKPARAVKGFRPFASRGGVVTNELVSRLRDDLEY